MVELPNRNISIGYLLGHDSKSGAQNLLCFVHGQGQKQKHGTKNFVGRHNHFLLGLRLSELHISDIKLIRTLNFNRVKISFHSYF